MTGGEILTGLLEMIGPEKTRHLLALRGGEEVYIPGPDRLSPDHWLAVAVGLDGAVAIADAFKHEKITLPLGPESGSRNALQKTVLAGAAAGLSVNELVRETGLHARTVRRIKNRRTGRVGFTSRPADPRQGRLFGDIYDRHDQAD